MVNSSCIRVVFSRIYGSPYKIPHKIPRAKDLVANFLRFACSLSSIEIKITPSSESSSLANFSRG